jgi:hypothetical protein
MPGNRDSFKPFIIDREGQCCKHPAPVQQTPTTLFSDSPITPTEKYNKVVTPERTKLLLVLIVMLLVCPLVFRYACGSSNNDAVSSQAINWAGNLDPWEWVIVLVIWVGVVGFMFRLLPMITGGPSSIESSRQCKLDGVAALGCCSPFSTEDDTILLRSLIGRTCTVFHTTGGRHSIQGFYVDAILNERRIKGEANRRNLWISWMKFLHALVDVSLLIKEEAALEAVRSQEKPPLSPEPEPEGPAEDDAYRPIYVQGAAGAIGVTAPAQHERNRPVSFRDVGLLLDTTRGMTESRRQQVISWSKDAQSRPLSMSMSAAQTGTVESTKDGPSRHVHNLAQIAENEDEEEKELDDDSDSHPASRVGGPATVPVQSALEAAEVDDDDIEMAAFRCADDADFRPEAEAESPDSGHFSEKSNPIRSSRKRISPALHGGPRVTASGADNRASSAIVIDMRVPGQAESTPGRGAVVGGDFPITPNKKPRPMSQREQVISTAYLRPHGLANLELNMSDLVPMIHLLDAWLGEIKKNEWTYNYHNQK